MDEVYCYQMNFKSTSSGSLDTLKLLKSTFLTCWLEEMCLVLSS